MNSEMLRWRDAAPPRPSLMTPPLSSSQNNDLNILPNELWSMIFSYFNIVDLFTSFSGLNSRFDQLIHDVPRIVLSKELDLSWIDTHMPRLSKNVRGISLRPKHLQNVFNHKWSFKNLQFIHLNAFHSCVTLKNDNTIPISKMLNSSMTLLELISSLPRTRNVRQQNTSATVNSRNIQLKIY